MLQWTYEAYIFRKGIAQSALPYKRSVPTWQKLTADEVKETIYKLSKKGLTPSQIGVILRDSHGVNQVRFHLHYLNLIALKIKIFSFLSCSFTDLNILSFW